jgi:transposase
MTGRTHDRKRPLIPVREIFLASRGPSTHVLGPAKPDPGGGLTGAPDESGARRREKGLARAGNARVRRGMIQLAWRFLMFQKKSALAQWYQRQTAGGRGSTRKTMIVALARKLLVALWRLVTTGEVPEGVVLRQAAA